MLALLLATLAHSGGHYSPGETAAQSTVYAKAAQVAGSTFRDQQARVEAVATALAEYRTSLDLLGDRAQAEDEARQQALQKQFSRERAVLQVFATTMMEDFDGVFQAALARALPPDAVACQARIPSGASLPGMPVPMRDNPDCIGADLNAQLGAAMDADPILNAAIDEIIALEWPAITVDATARPADRDAEAWIATARWFRKNAGKTLKAIDRADDEARLPFEAAMEQGATTEALKKLVADARAVTEATAARRAALAGPVLTAADAWSAKRVKKGGSGVAWCANPELLGGCVGEDVTDSLGAQLRADKKVSRALP